MSAFDEYFKDDAYDTLKVWIQVEKEKGKSNTQIMEELFDILKALTYYLTTDEN